MKRRTLLGALPAVGLLAGCGQLNVGQPLYRARLYSFGGFIDLQLVDVSASRAAELTAQIERALAVMNSAWHAWKPGALETLNAQLRSGTPFTPPPALLALLLRCQWLYERSEGLFNPAMGGLIRRWGFHSDVMDEARTPPNAEPVPGTEQPTMAHIRIENGTVWGEHPELSVDLGGFAKGHGLALIAAQLRAAGVRNALVSATSNLVALGQHGDRPWRIAIRHPRRDDRPLAWLELHDGESLSSSGDYERYFEYQGQRYHHILDPRTGQPARDAQAVTLLHTDGALADAASTALMVAGPSGFARVAERLGVTEALLVKADGELLISPALAPRLHRPDSAA